MAADEKVIRAALAKELGFYPASTEPEDVKRYRWQIADQVAWEARARASSLTSEQLQRKYAHRGPNRLGRRPAASRDLPGV